MAKKKKVEPKYIVQAEMRMAAQYMTLSNLACTHYLDRTRGNVAQAYSQCNEDMASETGQVITPEFRDWEKSVNAGDPYVFEQWEKAKNDGIVKI